MSLISVRDLVSHARRHGYLAPSFNVHASQEIKALVAAAEACRAPVILAIDTLHSTFLDYGIALTVAGSVAARASVPVAIEAVIDGESFHDPRSAMSLSTQRTLLHSFSPHTRLHFEATLGADEMNDPDWEFCLPVHVAVEELALARPWANADRLAIALSPGDRNALRPGALRKHTQAIAGHFGGALVVDGDLDWPEATWRVLPQMGVAKVNFDRRLRQAMAKANRQVATRAEDDYRRAMEYVAAALMEEVSACLRRLGATGRAADVIACASFGVTDKANTDKAHHYQPARRYRYDTIVPSSDILDRRRVMSHDECSLHT